MSAPKTSLFLVALAIVGALGQQAPPSGGEAAPEPYSYGYETDSHAASEQRDASGKVTGFYTLQDADGRQRRVEYVADESGFRAKVATNEVGTKSENPADVEIQAAPPTQEQLVVYQSPPQVQQQQQVFRQQQVTVAQPAQQQQQRFVSQVVSQAAPQVSTTTSSSRYGYVQQPGYAGYGYGYYPNAGYVNQGAYGSGYYGAGYGTGYGSGASYGNGVYTSYNNHLPSSYYRSISSTSGGQQLAGVANYVSQPAGGSVTTTTTRTVGGASGAAYRTVPAGGVSYTSYGVPAGGVGYQTGYQTVGVGPATRTVSSSSSTSNLLGSNNYIVLKA